MSIRNIFSNPKMWNVCIVILVMAMFVLIPAPVHASAADDLSDCGADGQRACCAGT